MDDSGKKYSNTAPSSTSHFHATTCRPAHIAMYMHDRHYLEWFIKVGVWLNRQGLALAKPWLRH